MNKFDWFIIAGIIVVIIVSILTISDQLKIQDSLATIGIVIAFLTYLISAKQDDRSKRFFLCLLDDNKRKIVEHLEVPKTLEEIVQKTDLSREAASDILDFLSENGIVRIVMIDNKDKFERTF